MTDYFTNLEVETKLHNNKRKIDYLKAKKDEYNKTYMECLPVLSYSSAKLWDDKAKKVDEKLIAIIEENHKLRKKLMKKPQYKTPQIYTLADYKINL
jgi:hypothetical protein